MTGAVFFFVILAALVAAKCAALIAVDGSRPDGLPRPSQIDWELWSKLAGVSEVAVCKWCRRVPGPTERVGVQWLIQPEPFAELLGSTIEAQRAYGCRKARRSALCKEAFAHEEA